MKSGVCPAWAGRLGEVLKKRHCDPEFIEGEAISYLSLHAS